MPRPWQPSPAIKLSAALHLGAGMGIALAPAWWPAALGVLAANHAVLTAAGLWPRSRLLGPNVTRLPAGAVTRGEVALTFDDGPLPEVTPRVLDLLDAAGAKASFFCIGELARRHPAIAREIVARGHDVQNHSMRHLKHFAAFGPRRMRQEIAEAQECLAEACGRAPRFFRPTAGLRSPFLEPLLCRLDLRLASWTRRGFDTRCGDPALLARRLLDGLRAGDILLLHDGSSAPAPDGRPSVLAVLPRVLEALRAADLRAVRLTDALPEAAA
jgi:peptidoglycan/xylan/chitin deacetylase (PgdA/CDA1 family)